MRVLRIYADDTKPIEEVLVIGGSAENLAKALDEPSSQWIERVVVGDHQARKRFDDMVMAVDEEGRLKGLPVNPRASVLYGKPVHGVNIHGTALLVGEGMVGDGIDFMDLPERYTAEWAERVSREDA